MKRNSLVHLLYRRSQFYYCNCRESVDTDFGSWRKKNKGETIKEINNYDTYLDDVSVQDGFQLSSSG